MAEGERAEDHIGFFLYFIQCPSTDGWELRIANKQLVRVMKRDQDNRDMGILDVSVLRLDINPICPSPITVFAKT